MEKVLRNVSENGVIILFVITVLASTLYMGISERRLSTYSGNNILSIQTR